MTLESQILNLNARQILIKRLSTAQALSYTGPLGELVLDTTLKLLRIQDGVTPGGILVTSADYLANQVANVQSQLNFIKSNLDPAALDSLTEIVANVNALLSNNVESQLFNSGNYANLMPNGDLVISGDLLPKTHLLQDLGSPTQAWANLYVGASTIYFGTVPVSVTSSGLQVGSGSNKLPVYGNVRFEDGTLQTTAYNPAYLAQLQYLVTPPVANNLVTIYNTIDKGLISNVAVLQANVGILEEQVHIVMPLGIRKTVTTDVNGSSLGGVTNPNRTTIAFSSYQERNAAINIVANASTTNTEINSQVILLGTVTGTIEVGQAVYKMTPTPTLIGEVGTQLTASAYNLDVLGLDPNVAIAPGTRLEFYRSGFVEYGTKSPMQIIWANGNVTLITSTSTNNPFGSQLTLHTAVNQTLLPYPIIVETMIYEPSYKEHVFNSVQRITSRYGNINVYGGTTDINLITNNKRLSLLRTGNLVIPGSINYPDGTIQSTAIPDRLISNNAQLVLNASGPDPYVLFPAASTGGRVQISEAEVSSIAGNLALTSAQDAFIISNGDGTVPGGSRLWKFDRNGAFRTPGDSITIGGYTIQASNNNEIDLANGSNIVIKSDIGRVSITADQSEWLFHPTGNLELTRGSLKPDTANGFLTVEGPLYSDFTTVSGGAINTISNGVKIRTHRVVDDANYDWDFAWDGSVYPPYDSASSQVGAIEWRKSGNVNSQIKYTLGSTVNDVVIPPGLIINNYAGAGGFTIKADSGAGGSGASKYWTFNPDGSMTTPGLLKTGNIQVGKNIYGSHLGGISNAIQLRPNIDIDKRFLFTVDSSSGNYIRSGMEMPMAEVNKAVTLGFPHNNGHVGYIYSQGSDANSTEFNNAFNIMSNGVDLKLSAFNSNDKYVWTFDVKGNITLPQTNMNTSPAPVSLPGITWTDGTFQTTAYTGAAATVDILNTNNLSNTFYPTFVEFRTTGQYVRADVDFTYRSDSNTLTVPKIAGMLQGNVDHLGGYINFTGSPAPGTSGITFADGLTQTTAYRVTSEQKFDIKSTGFGVVVNTRYGVNTASGAVIATLPPSPSLGDAVFFADAGGALSTNSLTIARNGNTIMGSAADIVINTNGDSLGLFWNGTTWRLYE